MIKEEKRCAIINAAKRLNMLAVGATREPAIDSVLTISEDYPKKNYEFAGNWLSRLLQENLFDWQKDIEDISVLELMPKTTDVLTVDKEKLKHFSWVEGSVLAFQFPSIDCWMHVTKQAQDFIAQMIFDDTPIEELSLYCYLFAHCHNIEIQKYEGIEWIVRLVIDRKIQLEDELFQSLIHLNEIERELFCIIVEAAASGSFRQDKVQFSSPELSLKLLKENPEFLRSHANDLASYWLKSGSYRDLNTFYQNVPFNQPCYSELQYLNAITSFKYSVLQLPEWFFSKCCRQGQFRFLNKLLGLVTSRKLELRNINYTVFGQDSIFQLCNLNGFSESEILTAFTQYSLNSATCSRHDLICEFANGRKLTPKEYLELMNPRMSRMQIAVYFELQLPPEEALHRVRELPSNCSLRNLKEEKESAALIAIRLQEKPFSKWRGELSYISNLTKRDVIQFLRRYDTMRPFLKELQSLEDFYFLLNNADLSGETLQEKQNSFLESKENQEFLIALNIPYKDAFRFLQSGCFEIAKVYYNSNTKVRQKENLLKIARASALGKLNELKYAELTEEIQYSISQEQAALWIHNTRLSRDSYQVAEYDDFKSIMTIGECPTHTCQSYRDGSYRDSLLSNFDANKKIVYVTKNGEVLARAILRLTKASTSAKAETLSFIDVQKQAVIVGKSSVELCLFLEKAYLRPGLSEEEVRYLRSLLKQLADAKAKQMGLSLYCNCQSYQGEKVTRYIFISRSKNGQQYLDSLTGNTTYSEEAKYHKANVIV